MLNYKRILVGVVGLAMLFAALPGIAAADLPPRPTPIPTPNPTSIPSSPGAGTGALIELQVSTASLNYHTVVQWQDIQGLWHTVDSWQGNLDDTFVSGGKTIAYKRWWVNSAQFGLKNFRWQVYDRPNGKLLVTSQTFDLPTYGKQQVIAAVTLP
jgi:hypothetical protein